MKLAIDAARRLYWQCIITSYRTWAHFKPVLDLSGSPDHTVLIAGSPRSGTTWVGNVIATMTGARSLFEPMLLNRVKELALLRSRYLNETHLLRNYQLYIRPDVGEKTPYYQPLKAILNGRVRGRWCDATTAAGVYWHRVIKEVRANLFLAYLTDTWPELKVVWLVRHPFSVINSQMEKAEEAWGFDWYPECVLDQPEVLTDWLEPHIPYLRKAGELWQRLAHKWCIETLIPLRQAVKSRPNVVFVKYEELKREQANWESVARHVSDSPWDWNMFERVVQEPSHTSRRTALELKERQERYPLLDEHAREGILRIVAQYGLESVYPFRGEVRNTQ